MAETDPPSATDEPERLVLEVPAAAGRDLIDRGLARPVTSQTRIDGGAVDLVVAVVGATPPTMFVSIARAGVAAATRQLLITLDGWWRSRQRGRRLILELDQRKRRTRVRVEATGDSPDEAVVEMLAALERVVGEQPDEK